MRSRTVIGRAGATSSSDFCPCASVFLHAHPDRPERRDVASDRGLEHELAFLDQHEGADADDRLGHRVDAEDVVDLHRRRAGGVAPTDGVDVRQLAAANDHQHGTRDLVLPDLRAQPSLTEFNRCVDSPTCSGVALGSP
jgi:hypothetical protein